MTWPTPGSNWEGGFTDHHGCRWTHEPNRGWTVEHHHDPPYIQPAEPSWRTRWRTVVTFWRTT